MAKQNDQTFWASPEIPEDWEGMVSYLRPRSTEEIHNFFSVRPPGMPDPSSPPPELIRRRPTFLEQLSLTEDEFVSLALSQPHLWDEDELDYLHLAAQEGEVDERLDELARTYFSGHRQGTPKKDPKPKIHIEERLDTDFEDAPSLPGINTIPDLETLEGMHNVDRWWEKQKE